MWFMLTFLMFGATYGHMGISITAPKPLDSRDRAVGDAYRYPNSGHCHGIMPGNSGAEFSPGDMVTLTLSSGAAHDGGHCALFLASKNTQPTEKVWYKQMDKIDCTKIPSFTWTIDPTLVPSECAGGCTLIWVWTPKSSGACEIYQNCFDITISNPLDKNTASSVQVTREVVCNRVDNTNRQTSSYGKFCGDSCASVQGSGTAPPTVSPGSAPPPTMSPAVPYRCGTSWVDANENCDSPTCTADADCVSHPSTPRCYADMIRVCTAITLSPTPAAVSGNTNSPTVSQVPSTKCRAIGVWAGVSGMDKWCAESCPTLCPQSHCVCDDSTQALNPTTITYQPSCQVVVSKQGDTLATITEANDLSSNIPGSQSVPDKTIVATNELYQYNVLCNSKILNKNGDEWPKLPLNTQVYLTGDCQLTNACVSISDSNSALRVSIDLVGLIAVFGMMWVGVN